MMNDSIAALCLFQKEKTILEVIGIQLVSGARKARA